VSIYFIVASFELKHKYPFNRIGTIKVVLAGCWWLTPVILATLEAEIRRIVIQSQTGQIVQETLSRKYPSQKRADGVA
jgi:hypothetical protein